MQRAKTKLMNLVFPFLLVSLFSMYAIPAEAGGYFAKNPDAQPSIFTYGLRGIGVGALDGLAVGYLVTYLEVSDTENWRILLAGMGIGAIGGAVLGLGVGFLDLAMYSKYPNGNYVGLGAVILRDSLYGALFGTLMGAIGGGVVAIMKKDAEVILPGMAIGTLSGTGLGILVGIIEGRVLTRRHRAGNSRSSLHFNMGAVAAVDQDVVLCPGVAGTF